MPNNSRTQFTHNVLQRRLQQGEAVTTADSVGQDNPAPPPAPSATLQPAPPKKVMRTAPKEGDRQSTHQRITRQRKDVQLNLWVRPRVKTELQRVAKREGLSVSAAGEALLENALQQDIHTQHGALLETIIEKSIGKHMRSYSNRLAVLLVRSLFSAEHARSFAYNILGRQTGITDEELTEIKNGASNTARATITRITPQMKTLLEAVEQWLNTREEEVKASG